MQIGRNGATHQQPPVLASSRAWIGYVAPMAAFMALTMLEGWDGSGVPYTALYAFKAAVVTVTLVMARRLWKQIRLDYKMLGLGAVIGILGFIEWIYVDRYTPHFRFLGGRGSFNPLSIRERSMRDLFLAVRFYGLVLMVPLMEELFWRSFLLRWFTEPDFNKLGLSEFSWSSFAIVTAAFALSHPEWLAAAIFGAAMALTLKYTRSIFACIVAHSVTNLLLGIYVLHTGAWRLW